MVILAIFIIIVLKKTGKCKKNHAVGYFNEPVSFTQQPQPILAPVFVQSYQNFQLSMNQSSFSQYSTSHENQDKPPNYELFANQNVNT